MNRKLLILLVWLTGLTLPVKVNGQYVGSTTYCTATNYCLGTNSGSCYDECTFDNVSLTCRPTTLAPRVWACNNLFCESGNGNGSGMVEGCGPAVTCQMTSALCGGCFADRYYGWFASCGGDGAGCYARDVHFNCIPGTRKTGDQCTTCAANPSSHSMNCCGNGPSATPTRTPTPGGPTGGGGPSPTPGGGSSPTPTRTPTPVPAGVPTGLTATCLAGNQVRLSWNAVAGADYYSLRVDNAPVSWVAPPSCSVSPSNGTGPGDFCRDTTVGGATNYTFNITAGVTYSWWMHARRSADPAYWSGVAGGKL